MSTSTASPTSSTRACSTAGCRRSPIPARCGSPAGSAPWRASSATPRKSTTSASRSTKRCAGSKASTSPITGRCGGCSPACIAISAPRSWSIAIPCRRPPAPRTSGRAPMSCSATATAQAASPVVAEVVEADAARLRLCGQPQQALCRRLHHRALRQPGGRAARHPARDQPRALHGRAPLRALGIVCDGSPANSNCWPTGSPTFRSRSCGRTAPPRNRRLRRDEWLAAQEKGPLTLQERPKSREETPKEGDGNARSSLATALQQYTPRSHKTQVLLTYSFTVSPMLSCKLCRAALREAAPQPEPNAITTSAQSAYASCRNLPTKAAAATPSKSFDCEIPIKSARRGGRGARADDCGGQHSSLLEGQGWNPMTAIDFAAFVDELATVSGEAILPFFRTALGVEDKAHGGGFDPVTAADRAAETVDARADQADLSRPTASSARNSAPSAPTPNMSGCSIRSTAPSPSSAACRPGAR